MGTIKDAKERLTISDLLKRENIPTKGKNFAAIWRGDKTPSCGIHPDGHRWHDRGNNNLGGDVVDLYALIFNCSISEAINGILSISPTPTPTPTPPKQETYIIIKSILDNINGKLLEYAVTRGISARILNHYCKCIKYQNKNKVFYSIGFKNDLEGWVLRSPNFKALKGAASITTLNPDQIEVSIFEGFFDFLSAVKLFGLGLKNQTCIILNGTAFGFNLDLTKYLKINLYLDQGKGGRKLTKAIIEAYPHQTIDKSFLYQNHDDLNEYLTHVSF